MQIFPMKKIISKTIFSNEIELGFSSIFRCIFWGIFSFLIYHFENIHSCFSYLSNIYLRPEYARHFTKLINKVNNTQMHKSSLGQSYISHKWALILRKNKYKQVREKIILRPNAILLLTVLANYAFYYWSWLVPQQRMIHCMYILRVSTAKL